MIPGIGARSISRVARHSAFFKHSIASGACLVMLGAALSAQAQETSTAPAADLKIGYASVSTAAVASDSLQAVLGAVHGQGEIVSGIIRVELNRSRAGKCCRVG